MADRESLTRCLAVVGSGAVLAAIFAAGLVLGVTLFFSAADKATQHPSSGDNPLVIAAVGDGWMSGEGATAFFPGTDRPGQNQCRRTSTSYPYLVARLLEPPRGFDGTAVHSVACSGATTLNVIPFDGLDCRDDAFPEGCPQPQFERSADGTAAPGFQAERVPADADVVLVMIGAGDAQLLDVITLCATAHDSCASIVRPWADAYGSVLMWRLAATYGALADRAPSAEIFAVTYPEPLYRETCGRARLDQDEADFLSEVFIPGLNAEIAAAAAAHGVHVIDLADVFVGHRLCQPKDPDGLRPEPAMNSFQIRPVRGITTKLSSWFHGSFHPTEFGHVLMAEEIADEVASVLDGSPESRRSPADPEVGYRTGPETAVYDNTSPCGTHAVTNLTRPRPAGTSIMLADVDAGTTVCHRSVGDRWSSSEARDGDPTVPLGAVERRGFAAWNEVLYRSGGEWVRLTVVAPSDAGTAHLGLGKAWLWSWLVVVGTIVGHPVIFTTVVALVLGAALMWCTRRKRPPRKEEQVHRMTRRGAGR